MEHNYLVHHGILGQKWGKKMGPPYPLNDSAHSAREQRLAEKRYQRAVKKAEKKDMKWVDRNYDKLYKKVQKEAEKELSNYVDGELASKYASQLASGNVGRAYINDFNKKEAEIMNKYASDITAPSGRVVQFVAKRGGEVGVYMALADSGYDMSQVKNGVWTSGRIAYKQDSVETRER